MFQDTSDMPGMGNDLDRRSKKQLEEQKISIRNYKKIIVTFAFALFYSMRTKFLLSYSTYFQMDRAHRNKKNGLRMYGPAYRVGLSKRRERCRYAASCKASLQYQ